MGQSQNFGPKSKLSVLYWSLGSYYRQNYLLHIGVRGDTAVKGICYILESGELLQTKVFVTSGVRGATADKSICYILESGELLQTKVSVTS